MRYLHTMVRVTDLDASLDFYCRKLGLKQIRRMDHEKGRFSLVFVAPEGQEEAQIELTYNWDPEEYTGGRNFGHVAYEVDDIYAMCKKLMDERRHDQPPATRRQDGVRALARRHLGRAPPEGRRDAEGRAMVIDAEYRRLVSRRSSPSSRYTTRKLPVSTSESLVSLKTTRLRPSRFA